MPHRIADAQRPKSTGGRMAAWIGLSAAVLVFVILLPWLLLRTTSREAQEAEAMLGRTMRVNIAAGELHYDLRELEAAALALGAGMDSTLFAPRFNSARDHAYGRLTLLNDLLIDSPDQVVRLEQVKATLDRRLPAFDEAIALTRDGKGEVAREKLQQTISEYAAIQPMRAILNAENERLQQRRATAERAQGRNLRTIAAIALFQCLLLGLVALLLRRQLRQRLRAETASQRERRRSEAIFQSIREPIALVDDAQRVLLCNPAFGEAYGVDRDSPPSTLAALDTPPWTDPALLQRLRDVSEQDRELWDFELNHTDAQGHPRTLLLNARRITLPDRDAGAVLITLSDTTARKLAETRVLELNHQLESRVREVTEANQELEAFSYSVSHDLRAPLRHIAGFSEKLARQLQDMGVEDDKSRHYLTVIQSSAQRLAVLIDDLLAYSRLGRHAMRLQPVRMETLVAEVRSMLDPEISGRAIQWRIGPMPTVAGDESLLRQVWQNLIGNAVKYTRDADPARIEISARREGDFWEFSVIDNGAGFDMRYAGKLFGVFQRMHKASEYPGSGIGLAIVKRIVTRHGGDVFAEAEPGRGANFRFTLPAGVAGAQIEDIQ